MAILKLPGFVKRLATGRNSARRKTRPVQNISKHYTKRLQVAISQAKSEARLQNSSEISPEHLLLAITRDQTDLIGQFLAGYSIRPLNLQSIPQPSISNQGVLLELEPGQACKKILERATSIALEMKHPYIGTEHLLLAILEDEALFTELCILFKVKLKNTELIAQFKQLLDQPQFWPFAYE